VPDARRFHRAGIPASASDHLIARCREVIIDGRFQDRLEIFDCLAELQRYVCDKSVQIDADRRRGSLGGFQDVFGGLTIMALNGGLLATSVGLGGAAAAGSGGVSGVVAAEGYGAVRRYFG
jgi:hypothetical protein